MNKLRPPIRFAAATSTLFLTLSAHASAVTLQLAPAADTENTFELKLIVGISNDTDTSTGTGNVEVDFDYSIVDSDAVVTGIEFTGGQIDFSAINFSFLFGALQINGMNIAATTDTLVVPSPVVEGTFDASGHQLTVDQGVFVSSGLASQTIDISEMPFGGPGSGGGSVQITEISRTSQSVTYDASVLLPVAFVGRVQDTANGDPITVDVELSGNIVASGAWIVELPLAGDYSGDGLVDAVDYAAWRDNLGAPAGTLPNDVDGGTIGVAQFVTWRENFGTGPVSSTSGQQSAAPEPASLALIMMGVAASLFPITFRRGPANR